MLRYESFVGTLETLDKDRGRMASELVDEVLQRGGHLIGESPAMQGLRWQIGVVAQTDLTVLIAGESGVGKELAARLIHSQSARAAQPMVQVNRAGLPESLAESELFGHVRGAFTGAGSDRAGKFEEAQGGTLFLDEVGELPPAAQAKLLRALQFGEIPRLGSDTVQRVDVRIVVARRRTDSQRRGAAPNDQRPTTARLSTVYGRAAAASAAAFLHFSIGNMT